MLGVAQGSLLPGKIGERRGLARVAGELQFGWRCRTQLCKPERPGRVEMGLCALMSAPDEIHQAVEAVGELARRDPPRSIAFHRGAAS